MRNWATGTTTAAVRISSSARAHRRSFSTLLVINMAVSTVASCVPVPGGNTAVSAVGLTGPLVAVGVPEAAAVAAVLLNQVIAIYLPAIPGWFATRDLNRKGYL